MTKLRYLTFASIALLLASSTMLAQNEPSAPDTCAACGTCGAGIAVPIILILAYIALSIALLVWVARDAKARGMDSAVIWMILVFFTNWVGLLIYIFSRPQGQTVQCPHCNNKRLQVSVKCPHCGNP